jgi:hypothetical protein
MRTIRTDVTSSTLAAAEQLANFPSLARSGYCHRFADLRLLSFAISLVTILATAVMSLLSCISSLARGWQAPRRRR